MFQHSMSAGSRHEAFMPLLLRTPSDARLIWSADARKGYGQSQPSRSARHEVETSLTTLAKSLLSLLLLCSLTAFAEIVSAERVPPRDLVLLLDNSGSMRKADPERLIRRAVLEFARQAGPEDRIALVLFDHRARVLLGLADQGPKTIAKLQGALQSLDYRGRLTDMAAGVEKALAELAARSRPGAEHAIVFLTDGIVDTGNAARDAESTRHLRERLAATAARDGVRIHAVAFTAQADAVLLQYLANTTKAAFVRADSVADLTAAFADLSAASTRVPSPSSPTASATQTTAPLAAVLPSADASDPEPAPALAPEVAATVPPADPALTQLIDLLGVSPTEVQSVLDASQINPADVLELVRDGGLTLEQLRELGPGRTLVSRPGEATETVDTTVGPASALELLATRIGGAPGEAERLVEATRLPAEDLLALLDEAGLTLDELQGLAVGDAMVIPPGESPAAIATPEAGAASTPARVEGDAAPMKGDRHAPATDGSSALAATAAPALSPEMSGTPAPQARGPVPTWIIATTIAGVVLIAVGALLAVRPRRRGPLGESGAKPTTIAAAADVPPPIVPPEAWLTDPQRHSGHERILLGARPLAIGRVGGTEAERLDYLLLNQPTIGRRHALIEFRDYAWYVSDLGSVNGTFLNGQRIGGQPQRLHAGDRIRFHRYEFGFVQATSPDHDATLAAELPGEATLVADRTLTSSSSPGLAAAVAPMVGAAGSQAIGALMGRQAETAESDSTRSGSAASSDPPADDDGPPGSLATGGARFSATGDLTEPNFNPAAHLLDEEAGLDLFMASQMFAATTLPAEDLLGTAAADEASDGSTVLLSGPLATAGPPSAPVGESNRPAAVGPVWPRPADGEGDQVTSHPAGSATEHTGLAARPAPRLGAAAPSGSDVGGDAGIFDEDFFATHDLPMSPLAAAARDESTGGRGPADIFFPSTPGLVGGAERAPAVVTAPDHPPLAPEDELFTGHPTRDRDQGPAGPAPTGASTDDFFATVVLPVAPEPADSPDLRGLAPGPSSTETLAHEEADALFATVFRATEPAAPVAASEARATEGRAADAALLPATDDTLQVRPDRTLLLGETTDGPSPQRSGEPAPDAASPQGQPVPVQAGTHPRSEDADDLDAFFTDDERR